MTGLLYGGRVLKTDSRIECVGAFDEFNVALGDVRLLLAERTYGMAPGVTAATIEEWQHLLFSVMGEVSAPDELERYLVSKMGHVTEEDLAKLDRWVEVLEASMPPPTDWELPGASALAQAFHHARVACRRAERAMLVNPVRPVLAKWVNRFSDVLWLMARKARPL